jgi:co-chaperonin GroES (HSP10)
MLGTPEVERPSAPLEIDTTQKNIIFIVAGKLGLQAIESNILVLIDKFRSGYECQDCAETGKYISCECERKGHPGQNRLGGGCKYCNGKYEERRGRTCPSCNGTGSTIVMPENARAIPTSGVIVSIGPKCTARNIGERVLFGAHTGYYLPFKGNAKIRVMREDEPMCKILAIGTNEVVGDFLQIEDQQ